MTLTTLNVQKAYTGDGSTKIFAVDFQFWDAAELAINKRVIATGVETLQLLFTDYNVTGGDGSTGTVDFAPDADGAPTALEEVHIRRVTVPNQAKDLTPHTVLPSAAVEEALDRDVMLSQEDRFDLLDRALLIPRTDIPVSGTAPNMELPNLVLRAVANAVLGFDATTGNPTVVVGATLPSVTVSAFGADLVDEVSAATTRTLLGAIFNVNGVVDNIDAGVRAARPVPATFGQGIWIDTDRNGLSYSDGSDWEEIVIGQFTNATLPASVVAGRIVLDTDNLELLRDSGSALVALRPPMPRGAHGGMALSLSGSDQDVTVSVGEARAGTSADRSIQNALLTTAITKQMDTAGGWVAGTNQAGRPAADALAANKWHHVFVLTDEAGLVDVGFDDDINAANLIAAGEAGGETPPFINFRYRGSVKETASGNGTILPFLQHGDSFLWTTVPGLDINLTAQDLTTQTTLTLDFVPPDVKVKADIQMAMAGFSSAAIAGTMGHGGTTIPTPGVVVSALGTVHGANATERERLQLLTDLSQHIVIRVAVDTTVDLYIEVNGYENARGRWD